MLEQLQTYLEEQGEKWNNFLNRVDTSYEIKSKTFFDKGQVFLYKVGEMGGDELTWNFVTGVEIAERRYIIHFFLDVEEDIIHSLINAGHAYRSNHWMKEFIIEVATLEEVKTFYEEHVWRFDPGYFY